MTDYSELLNKDIECACGRTHRVPIKDISFDFKEEDILEISKKHIQGKNILIVADKHTHDLNQRIYEIMQATDYDVSLLEFEDKKLIPDEKAVGKVLMTTDRDIAGIISVGSGTINDINRLVANRVKIPVITIATAPSMDGYAASGSSMVYNGVKKTIKNGTVTAIYGKVDVIKEAPYDLIQAGFGDSIGKKTALADWILSKHINDEYWCDKTVALVEESTNICIENAEKIAERDTEAIKNLVDALVLSGVCMSLVDDTRPASGSEHLVSHYMVMRAIEKGELPPSHGRTVAIGTLIATVLYEFLFKHDAFKQVENYKEVEKDVRRYLPTIEEVEGLLKTIKLSTDPRDYDLDGDLLREIVLKAGYIRQRYTVFMLLDRLNLLDEAADYVLNHFNM
ncbi:glycerol-1-phosphate dehydrogenase [NAD(P)+] [Alkalibaculum bacchi]|uniref:Glycerol-1-phosphate dehydrogenase [NAD(P)+] n=1 Tax=Alkalibaculum bacchi TaxID=645887 RepID=A0A366IB28_9FIRM|nr:sn-glycerol-1-phosphate dehydrogenase [Alkalibaculum bacchi]RBP65383.1 glycerol-1-phosphate dehydrogenase [NAD(P)+] [Alkalibaculum bacchi]